MTPRRKRNPQAGMTLVEMMISLVILNIAVAAVLGMGTTMIDGYQENRRMVAVESSARGSLDIISDVVRNASPGVPSGDIADAVGCSTFGAVQVTNSDAGPDELAVIHASGGAFSSLRAGFTSADNQITILDGTELASGDYLVVTNLDQGVLVQIDTLTDNGGDWTVTLTDAPSTTCPAIVFPATNFVAGDLVVRARLSRFFVQVIDTTPTLMMDPDGEDGPEAAEPLAQSVEDFQIAVGVDADEDGEVVEDGTSADEWHYNTSGDADPPAVNVTPWRAVRISVVARSMSESNIFASNLRPRVEDHPIATTPDVFRRRVLSATVEVRNLDGSP
jgi:prepilin-type N-terminal cleavage/methylation domain-containing protein